MIRPLFLLAAVVALPLVANAQRPSNWTTLALPTDATSVPNSIGTMVSFTTATSVYLYSGITKQWTVLPFVPTSPIFQANDYAIVRNGNQIYGYSSHTGAAQMITTASTMMPDMIVAISLGMSSSCNLPDASPRNPKRIAEKKMPSG